MIIICKISCNIILWWHSRSLALALFLLRFASTLMAIVRALLYNTTCKKRTLRNRQFSFLLFSSTHFRSSFAIGCCLQLEHSNEYTCIQYEKIGVFIIHHQRKNFRKRVCIEHLTTTRDNRERESVYTCVSIEH